MDSLGTISSYESAGPESKLRDDSFEEVIEDIHNNRYIYVDYLLLNVILILTYIYDVKRE
jgi:hypothetical protein